MASHKPKYTGPVKAVVFDWAGTLVDFGSCAPAGVFVETFARHGVTITREQARGPMGSHKRRHTELISQLPEVTAQWKKLHGREFSQADIDMIYEDSIPLQVETLPHFSDPIPGIPEMLAELRERGIKIGSTTGYVRKMMDALQSKAAEKGVKPDSVVVSDDVAMGRPSPLMALKSIVDLGIWPVEACIKVGDTPVDVLEGLNAGMWTAGITGTGNGIGLAYEETMALPAEEYARMKAECGEQLKEAGAHFIIESSADIFAVIEEVEKRLAAGELP